MGYIIALVVGAFIGFIVTALMSAAGADKEASNRNFSCWVEDKYGWVRCPNCNSLGSKTWSVCPTCETAMKVEEQNEQ